MVPEGQSISSWDTDVAVPSPKCTYGSLPEAALVEPQKTSRIMVWPATVATSLAPQPSRFETVPTGRTSSQWALPSGVTLWYRCGEPFMFTTYRSIRPSRS